MIIAYLQPIHSHLRTRKLSEDQDVKFIVGDTWAISLSVDSPSLAIFKSGVDVAHYFAVELSVLG